VAAFILGNFASFTSVSPAWLTLYGSKVFLFFVFPKVNLVKFLSDFLNLTSAF
jgi:hypothetical protein